MQLGVKEFTENFGGMRRHAHEMIKGREFLFSYLILPNFKPEINIKKIGDKERWEKGWQENLEAFKKHYKEEDLIPKYYHPQNILRYKDWYIKPQYDNFELHYLDIFRTYIFRYFKPYQRIYEFGCGTGFNLLELWKMYPKKELHGLDWAQSSLNLLSEINKTFYKRYWGVKRYINIQPHFFDMFNPPRLEIPDNSAILTWGALEQLGNNFNSFLHYIANKKVFVINIEPIAELYDPNNPMDKHSLDYMEQRGYLKGYLTALLKLEVEGKVEIQRIQRQHFGNLNYEGWSFIIWKTRN